MRWTRRSKMPRKKTDDAVRILEDKIRDDYELKEMVE